jgi:hypothetical protein
LLCRRLPAGRRREEVIQALRPVAAERKGSMAREEVVRALRPVAAEGKGSMARKHGW